MPGRTARSTWEAEYRDEQAIPSTSRRQPSRALTMLVEAVDATAVDRVLAVGCGNGRNLPYLAAQFPDAEVTGLDFADEAVERARDAVAASEHTDRVEVVAADALSWLPERSGAFDLVVDSYFSCHLLGDARDAYLDAVRAALGPDGTLYWAGMSEADEYYATVAEPVDGHANVVRDPENDVVKRLYGRTDLDGGFDGRFDRRLAVDLSFSDPVEGESYERRVLAGLFDR